jgi:predicted DsbA family dithiol-disulfide isomerase
MKIDVWYDVVCPWCWLGKARLDTALAGFDGRDGVEVVTHSFELDPRTPADLDVAGTDMLQQKFGMGRAQIESLHGRIAAMGREVGIEFRFDRVRTANTFDAHQLVHHARATGGEASANAMVDRLFRANFRDGLRVGSRDVLLGLAKEAGLDEADVRAALDEQRHASLVRADEARAEELGVNGVPFFVFDGKLRVSGAQSVDILRTALERAR